MMRRPLSLQYYELLPRNYKKMSKKKFEIEINIYKYIIYIIAKVVGLY